MMFPQILLAAFVVLVLGAAWAVRHATQQKKVRLATEKAMALKDARTRRLARRAERAQANWASIHTPRPGLERRPVVLVIDDNEQQRVRLKRLLEDNAYRVIVSENGKRAWATMQEQRPDVIITDTDMPYLTGYQLLNLLRQDLVLADVPVLLMTTRKADLWQEEKSSGAHSLLPPSFSDDELVGQVQFLLQE